MRHIEAINFFEAVEFGWVTLKKNFIFLLELSVLAMITLFCLNFFNLFFDHIAHFRFEWYVFSFLYNIIISVFIWTVYYNIMKINLDTFHGRKHKLSDLFELPTVKVWRYFAVNVIYWFLVISGLLFFIIPGIYFGMKYFYARIIVVDKNVGILEAGRLAAEIMQGEKWQMFAYLFASVIICIVMAIIGLCCLIIGIFPAIFIAYWLFAFANLQVYKKLLHR